MAIRVIATSLRKARMEQVHGPSLKENQHNARCHACPFPVDPR